MHETFIEKLMLLLGMIFVPTFTMTIMVGIPLLFIYVIYRAIKGLMTHNAELKARERDRIERDL